MEGRKVFEVRINIEGASERMFVVTSEEYVKRYVERYLHYNATYFECIPSFIERVGDVYRIGVVGMKSTDSVIVSSDELKEISGWADINECKQIYKIEVKNKGFKYIFKGRKGV